jgi:hypothetical protein
MIYETYHAMSISLSHKNALYNIKTLQPAMALGLERPISDPILGSTCSSPENR